MPKYCEKDYSLSNALKNIGDYFWRLFRDDLKVFAQDRSRTDIPQRIHEEWDNGAIKFSPFGTDIRIEWALAIYVHGDWERALAFQVPVNTASQNNETKIDPRRRYPAEYRCDNGIYVRSVSELCIANFLYANHVPFEYERSVYFSATQETAHCDFYLPNQDVYIEFWGMYKDPSYEQYKSEISSVAYSKCRTAIDELNNLYSDSKIEVVARYLLCKCIDVTPMALQKMLYYAQSFFQALFNKPLFTDPCQAWVHGPVYPDVYYKYRGFGYDPIKLPEIDFCCDSPGLSAAEINLLDAIIAAFGRYSGTTLKAMTHNEQPWLETRGSLRPNDRCVTVIDSTLINNYFTKIVQQYNIVNPCDISRYSEDMAKKQLY